jgi:hypothetical protein
MLQARLLPDRQGDAGRSPRLDPKVARLIKKSPMVGGMNLCSQQYLKTLNTIKPCHKAYV